VSVDVDVLVVGGGPVGLASAIEARLHGLSATVMEPRDAAIDKACGEGLMPGAIPALARLGVDPTGFPVRGISYRDATRRVDHVFASGEGRGVRRTTLHATLFERARELGVQFSTARVQSLEQDGASVTAAGVRARYLIGADGLHSTIRRLAGLERTRAAATPAADRRFGLRRHFRMEPESDFIEVYWTPDVEAYLTPVGGGIVGLAILGRRGIDYDSAIAGIPGLAERVAASEPVSVLRGAGPFRQRTSRRSRGRILLVGDASGYVDAITGEGIRVGLAQSRLAIDCLVAEDPRRYERSWTSATRDFRLITGGLVLASNSPLRRAIVPTAAMAPALFGLVVERLAR
jgi:flavin-dependent dehydrogenase